MASAKQLAIGCGDSVHVISLFNSKMMTIELDANVSQLAFASEFLIIVDSLGAIHFALESSCQIVFSQDLSWLWNDCPWDCKGMCVFEGDVDEIIVVYQNAGIRFYNIQSQKIRHAIDCKNLQDAQQVR